MRACGHAGTDGVLVVTRRSSTECRACAANLATASQLRELTFRRGKLLRHQVEREHPFDPARCPDCAAAARELEGT